MALMKWEPSPFKGIVDLKKEMDKIFEDFFGRRFPALSEEEFTFAPAIDLSETDSEIIVKAAIPGVDKKDVSIKIADNLLTIKGEIKKESEEKKKSYYRQEIAYGAFSRTIQLPADVKSDEAKANMKNGVLEIVIPKTEKAKAKEIKINIE